MHVRHEFHEHRVRDHGKLYELFHDGRFLAVIVVLLVIVGAFLFVKVFKNKLEGGFKYQPSYSP
jgi:hypothetical protein